MGADPADPGPRTGPFLLLGGFLGFAAIVVWALYHFVLGPGLMSNVVRRHRAAAQSEILELHKALEAWSALHQGHYPDSLEALVQPDAQGHTLLGDARTLPRDPWGRPFVYAPPGAGELRPKLLTLGRDGAPGGEDEDADVDREGTLPANR